MQMAQVILPFHYFIELRFNFFLFFLELVSVDGAIRVVSDEFSISLLNPSSELYKFKEDKYSKMVSALKNEREKGAKKFSFACCS